MYAGVPYRSASSTTSQPPTSRCPRSLTRVPSGYAWLRAVAAILPRHYGVQPSATPDRERAPGRHRVVPVAASRRAGPWPAVIVLHGAGSRKENHADYARAAVAHGLVALTFDNRGHGETEGDRSGTAVIDDLARAGGMARGTAGGGRAPDRRARLEHGRPARDPRRRRVGRHRGGGRDLPRGRVDAGRGRAARARRPPAARGERARGDADRRPGAGRAGWTATTSRTRPSGWAPSRCC